MSNLKVGTCKYNTVFAIEAQPNNIISFRGKVKLIESTNFKSWLGTNYFGIH